MKHHTKLWMITAGALCVAGLCVSGIALAMAGGTVKGLSSDAPVTQTFVPSGTAITKISIFTKNTPVTVKKSPDDQIHITYQETEYEKYTITEDKRELYMNLVTTRKWYHSFALGIFSQLSAIENKIQLELPESYTNVLEIATSNASVQTDRVHLEGNLLLKTSNGKISVLNTTANQVTLTTSNAGIVLEGVAAADRLNTQTSNSRISAKDVNAQELSLTTSNGGIMVQDVAAKAFTCNTSNGQITLNKTAADSIFLTTSNARISGTIDGKQSDYTIVSQTSNAKTTPVNQTGGSKSITSHTSNGSINLLFSQQ